MNNDDNILELCSSMREEEWQVLESIYPDVESRENPVEGCYKLELPVEMEPRLVQIDDDGTITTADGADLPRHDTPSSLTLSNLPPVLLTFILPDDYPLRAAPKLLSLRTSHSWLSSELVSRLRMSIVDIWQESLTNEEGTLWKTCEYIRSGEFLNDLRIVAADQSIRKHNDLALSTTFALTTFTCPICLTARKGSACLALSCGHVSCRSCLNEFWGLCIAEGDVDRVGCVDPACVKEGKDALEDEVRRICTEDEVNRWKHLKEKQAMERDPTVIHCPMAVCQAPVPGPKFEPDHEESGWDRLRTCQSCHYSFCAFCKRTWHGPISPCAAPSTTAFILEYLELPEDSPERSVIERRFGRNNVRKLVARYQEDLQNKAWMDERTMGCPKCQIKVEKSFGCNHMTCSRCSAHFCYRCGASLNASNPYAHFSQRSTPCFNKLFDFVPDDNDAWEPVDLLEMVADA